jgi:4-coumarate--CoA ligase
MPTESLLPRINVPDVDIWTFLFERKDREFPDDKGIT